MDRGIFRKIVQPNSMTSADRINGLYAALEYIRQNNIDGDLVECGVWRGGNILGMLKYLEYHNNTKPNVWLYDTFNGMTVPDNNIDVTYNNETAIDILNGQCWEEIKQSLIEDDYPKEKKIFLLEQVFAWTNLDQVKKTLSTANYPAEKIKFVIGDICQTLLQKENIPDKIALLRLDTDWYASTKIELEVLWDKLEVGAPCIIDDYGHWQGAKRAVDEFMEKLPVAHEIKHLDYTGVIVYKRG